MKVWGLVQLVLGVAALAGALGLGAYALLPGNPIQVLGAMLDDIGPFGALAKLVGLVVVAIVVVRTPLGLLGKPKRSRSLFVCSIVAPAAGLLSAAYAALNAYLAIIRLHVTDMRVPAPSFGEALAILGLTLLIGAAAAGAEAWLAARLRRTSTAATADAFT
jgi:hypothetical protein